MLEPKSTMPGLYLLACFNFENCDNFCGCPNSWSNCENSAMPSTKVQQIELHSLDVFGLLFSFMFFLYVFNMRHWFTSGVFGMQLSLFLSTHVSIMSGCHSSVPMMKHNIKFLWTKQWYKKSLKNIQRETASAPSLISFLSPSLLHPVFGAS